MARHGLSVDRQKRLRFRQVPIRGIPEARYPLDWEKVQIKGKIDDDKLTIESQCTFTKCDIPGSLTIDQIRSAEDCMEDSEDNGDLGKSVTTLKLDNNNLLKGTITSKGTWD